MKKRTTEEFVDVLKRAETIVVPKGRNQELALGWIASQGIERPEFERRQLHRI